MGFHVNQGLLMEPGHCKISVQWVTVMVSMIGVNTASKVVANTNTDSEQLEFTTIFEEYALEEEDSDVPVKSSQPTSSMMSSSD